jgi:hypothetical protein
VAGQLRQVGLEVGGVDRFERLARSQVELLPPRRAQVVVERVSYERVAEAKPAGRSGDVVEDALGDRLVECVEQLVAGKAADPSEGIQPELPAQNRRGHEQVPAAPGEPPEPASDHRAHSRRNSQQLVRRGDTAFGVQQPHHLADEERIAFGLGVDRLDLLRWRLHTGR